MTALPTDTRRGWLGVTVAAVVVVGVALVSLILAENLVSGTGAAADTVRAWMLTVSLTGLALVPYVAWPSRWNVPAHLQVAFCLVAYVVPILGLGVLDGAADETVDVYIRVVVVGFIAAFIGALIGRSLSHSTVTRGWGSALIRMRPALDSGAGRPVYVITALAVLGLFAAFVLMGFAPALAADPFSAKFFRGSYAAAYAPVAPLYRASSSVLALLLPVVALQAWRTRRFAWMALTAAGLLGMLLSLQREPAVSGILLAIGIVLASRGRGLVLFFALLIGTYFVGSALYWILGMAGFDAFSQGARTSSTWLEEVAAGAPDVKDQLLFLTQWLYRPEYTYGRTFIGGLVPGNNPWNPSVWSLLVANPGATLQDISSGGLRLPAPVWGLVSFGWPGVIAVTGLSGILTGYLGAVARHVVPGSGLLASGMFMVGYMALSDVAPVFFRLSYLSVIQLVIVAIIMAVAVRRSRHAREPALMAPGRF